jgi:hypothetical protein
MLMSAGYTRKKYTQTQEKVTERLMERNRGRIKGKTRRNIRIRRVHSTSL